jgi:aryl-alcohol dehydrogenase-like predicted oxidoreductase
MGPTNIGHNCMAWSALASGVLTCKYNSQVPSGSRFDVEQHTNVDFYWRRKLQGPDSKALVGELQRLARLALVVDCTPAQLALAWALSQHNVSTVILGVTTQGQLLENLQALKIANMMTPQVKTQLDQLFATLAD